MTPANPNARPAVSAQFSPDEPGARFESTCAQLIDRIPPRAGAKREWVEAVFSEISKKLDTAGAAGDFKNEKGQSVQGFKTGIAGVFRKDATQSEKFLVSVYPNDHENTFERTRKEVQLHLMLESFLNPNDAMQDSDAPFAGQAISLDDVNKQIPWPFDCQASPASTSTPAEQPPDIIPPTADAAYSPMARIDGAAGRRTYLFPGGPFAGVVRGSGSSLANQIGPIKQLLLDKQEELFHASDRSTQPPLMAHFASAATIDRYRTDQHFEENVANDIAAVNEKLTPGFYFAGSNDLANAALPLQAADPDVFSIHVDFANTCFGGGWKNDGDFAQEEIAFLENAGLAAVARQAGSLARPSGSGSADEGVPTVQRGRFGTGFPTRMEDETNPEAYGTPTPIVIENAIRVANFSAYGSDAAALSQQQALDKLTAVRPRCTNWLAIAAPDARRDDIDPLSFEIFRDLFSAAHAGFSAARDVAGPARKLEIHTGKLGCGVFGNNLRMSTAAQLLAARLVGVDDISFHGFEDNIGRGVNETADFRKAQRAVSEFISAAVNERPPITVSDLVDHVHTQLVDEIVNET